MLTAPLPQAFSLANGVRLRVTPNPGANIIAARLFVGVGTWKEAPSQQGISNLLAAVLTKGTPSRSALAIGELVEGLGAGFGTDATPDYFVVSLKAVGHDFVPLLTLAADVLRNPTFPPEEIELERRMVLQMIQAQGEQPFLVAIEQLRRALYPSHVYGVGSLGKAETVATLEQSDLQAFHRAHFYPKNLVISVAGAVDAPRVQEWVEQCFGDWQGEAPPETPPPVLPPPQDDRWLCCPHSSQQTLILLGYPVPGISHSAYVALKLLSTYLGGGMSSRLFVQLREQQGLAYDVSAFYPTRRWGSSLVAYVGTAPEKGAIALEQLHQELQCLSQNPLDEPTVQALRHKVLGQYLLGQQTNDQLAHLAGWYEILGLGRDFDAQFQAQVKGIQSLDLWSVARTYLQHPWVSLVGPESGLTALEPLRSQIL